MRRALLLLLMSLPLVPQAQAETPAGCPGTVLDSRLQRLTGAEESLCALQGKVVLAVNTASECGFTPQYEGLEALYQRYRERGLMVIGIPSDQFGGQEYADDAEIARFCKINFGVSFPMYTRSSVIGDDAIPLYRALTDATGQPPRWNFHKYLIGRDGRALAAWDSRVSPEAPALLSAIEAALSAP